MHEVPFEIRNPRGLPLRGEARWLDTSSRRPVVVVCHGFKGFKNWGFFPWLGACLATAGYLAVTFNFSGSGVGQDFETFSELDRFAADTITRQVEDLGTILDAVQDGRIGGQVADPARIAVLAHSRGGATAILRARSDRRVRAVATWAAVARLDRWSAAESSDWRERGFVEILNTRTNQTMRIDRSLLDDLEQNAGTFDVVRAAAELRVPLLVVHGAADEGVPAWEGSALAGAAGAEYLLLPGGGHTFGAVHPWRGTTPDLERATRHTIDWFDRQNARMREDGQA